MRMLREALVALAPSHVIVNIDENTRETFEVLRERVPHVVKANVVEASTRRWPRKLRSVKNSMETLG